jgi:hypothetical protein
MRRPRGARLLSVAEPQARVHGPFPFQWALEREERKVSGILPYGLLNFDEQMIRARATGPDEGLIEGLWEHPTNAAQRRPTPSALRPTSA